MFTTYDAILATTPCHPTSFSVIVYCLNLTHNLIRLSTLKLMPFLCDSTNYLEAYTR